MRVYIGPFDDLTGDQVQEIEIHNYDTWSMDHTLAPIILPMLKQLKETKHGAPDVDLEDVPEGLRPTNTEEWQKLYNEGGETDEKFFERWDWVLNEMIWAFEQKTIDWESQYYGDWVEDENREPFGGYHINSDHEGRKAHQSRMSNGFRLFGKYYENLWD